MRAPGGPRQKAALSLRGWGLSLLAGLVIAVALTMWTGDGANRRSTSDIEATIRQGLKSQGLAQGKVAVTCPEPVEWHPGRSFACLATDDNGAKGVAVTMGRTTADYTWKD